MAWAHVAHSAQLFISQIREKKMFDEIQESEIINLANGAQAFVGLEQGTEEWLRVRAGIATASRFKDVLTEPRSKADKEAGKLSQTALTYAYELAGEIVTGQPAESFSSKAMQRGTELEPQVRTDYELLTDTEVVEIGFVRRGRFGASPDGLVGADGMVEIKTHLPKLLVPMILAGDMPPDHQAQTQGGLWITDREWIDLCAFYPGMPMFRARAYRDDVFIKTLEDKLTRFDDEVQSIVERIQAYGVAAE